MPKKRSNFGARNKKEKQLITSRLIEISLKVDGYVYNHQPITESDAKNYKKEVVSYKTLCSGDERSLQVIEKLTRCMNAILVEHKELRNGIYIINDARSVSDDDFRTSSMSPVYSISDEDRTQLTQIADEIARSNTEANKDIEIIDLSNIDDDEVIDNDITNTGTEGSVNSKIHVEVDIHRAISNLSLREVEDLPDIISSDADFSQSILNNYEGIDNAGQNNINVTPNAAVTEGLIENFEDAVFKKAHVLNAVKVSNTSNINNVLSKIQNNEPVLTIQSNEILKSTNSNNVLKTPSNFKDKTIAQSTESKKILNTTNTVTKKSCQNNDQICKDTPDCQIQTWHDSDRTCTINNSGLQDTNCIKPQQTQIYKHGNLSNTFNKTVNFNVGIPIKSIEVQDARAARPITNNDKTINNYAIVNENSVPTKKKRAPRKKKDLSEDGVKPKNKTTNRTPKNTNKKASTNSNQKDQNIPIYNKNVENDLSWIENIRYVREIREDEHDSNMIIKGSFWNNYYLPGNWNEDEFL